MASSGDDAGRRARHVAREAKRSRRRRFWAGLIGGVVGWGLAGLDGGEAGTVEVPKLDVDFAAAGTYTSPEHGTVEFELVAYGRVVRQIMLMADDPVEMVFDRMTAKVTVMRHRAIEVISTGYPSVSLFDPFYSVVSLVDPFAQARHIAEGSLEIVRDGVGSYLSHACERYRAFGTVGGVVLQASACITGDGVPLFTEITSGGRTVRTELTELSPVSHDPRRFAVPLKSDRVHSDRIQSDRIHSDRVWRGSADKTGS